ncbi:flagellar motor switch phosphatase FliY [Salibacterium qingdaonense]|uniref:Flagellar motor switch protein FliN/FliY n=1 Tax=Salibacterium qingdaonense TaxID=266892 RepID=A0A1I4PQE9_9BACI|nr:flagellar motor switch phosphatase FliY [Salibacterium qingdaonense]SFM30007.1 flagellar motor switch protein FliN/FliY [Salibacterium qingdaonense]
MNDDMLSQEEINELLKSVEGGDDDSGNKEQGGENSESTTGEPGELNVEDYLSSVEQDALGEIGNISFGSSATALSQLLNQKVDITTPVVSVVQREKLDEQFPRPNVAVHVRYTEGFEGTNLLVIKTRDASIIADLMLGGDGTNPAEEMEEMHISAVQEAMNQMMGSASTSMSTVFNKRVDITPPGIDMMDLKNEEGASNVPDADTLAKISFRLIIGDLIDSSIMQLVSVPFAKDMVDNLMNQSEPEDEKAPEPEAGTQAQPKPEASSPQPSAAAEQQNSAGPERQSSTGDQERFVGGPSGNVQAAQFSSFDTPSLSESESKNLDMLMDIPLEVTVELGRTQRTIKDILEFSQGSIIELDKLAGEPVDILVNQKLVAKGEVVVIDENFGVRVTDIVSQADRIKKLK